MNETAKIIEKMQAKKLPAEQVERVRGVLERMENRLEPMPDFAAEIIADGNARQRSLPGYATREVRRDA